MPGDGVDLIRDAVTMVLQGLTEVDAAERIGAARDEHRHPGDGSHRVPAASVDDAAR